MIKTSPFAAEEREAKLNKLGDRNVSIDLKHLS